MTPEESRTEGSSDEQLSVMYAKRGFGLRMGFGERPALIVVDFINAFTDPGLPLGGNLDTEIEATNELLQVARDTCIPIFFTVEAYEEQDFRDAGLWMLKQRGILSLAAGTPAVQLDPRLERRENEPTILKKYASAFFGTDLITRLNTRRIDTLLITGCTTSGCVRATAVDALQWGIRPMVIREAVGDRDERAHRQSLIDLQQKYADVVTLGEAAEYLLAIAQPTDSANAPNSIPGVRP
jgi:maleamate amidohydrolase